MPLRRPRAVLVTTGVLAAITAASIALLSGCTGLFGAPTISTVGMVDFDRPLAIPPLAPSTVRDDGTRVFELTADDGETEFVDGIQTRTAGYNGSYLGPTLRAAAGEKVEIDLTNDLDEVTTLHWHGMHLPPEMDGGPHQPVQPGAVWRPHWTIDQPAATLWYHPHPHGETAKQVRNGLAGMFILDDPVEAALPLPREYGVDDIPVIVQDASIGTDGTIGSSSDTFIGRLGDTLLVNGTVGPYLEVSTDVVRLRLLNASAARIYRFAFADGRGFAQIASDGGLLPEPVPATDVQLSPGERAEVLVRMTPGESVVLRSEAPDYGGVVTFGGGADGRSDRFDVLELRAAATLRTAGSVPDALAPVPRIDPATASEHRLFSLDGTQINQHKMDMGRIDVVATVDTVEVWDVRNDMAFPHSFHVHDVQFQVVSIGGKAPPPELAGWKDTVYLRPNTDYRLVMRFADYADPEHPYMYHCHLLRHEDAGMMGQFLVVAPGQQPKMEETTDDHH